jgi:hypothetical protein
MTNWFKCTSAVLQLAIGGKIKGNKLQCSTQDES